MVQETARMGMRSAKSFIGEGCADPVLVKLRVNGVCVTKFSHETGRGAPVALCSGDSEPEDARRPPSRP